MTTTEDLTIDDCLDNRLGLDDPTCAGEVLYRDPLSGTGKSFPRCDRHWSDRLDRQAEIDQRYPSQAPSDWSPYDAGESWDDDY